MPSRDWFFMPALILCCLSLLATCALVGCSGGDLQPIQLGDAGTETDSSFDEDADAGKHVTPHIAHVAFAPEQTP